MQRRVITPIEFVQYINTQDLNGFELKSNADLTDKVSSSARKRTLTNCKIADLKFPIASFNGLTFDDCEIGSLEFHGADYKELKFRNCTIKSLIIQSPNSSEHIEITDCGIENISIIQIRTNIIAIYNSIFKTLDVTAVTNNAEIRIKGNYDPETTTIEEFKNSLVEKINLSGKLGKVHLDNLNIQSVLGLNLRITERFVVETCAVENTIFNGFNSQALILTNINSNKLSISYSDGENRLTLIGGAFKLINLTGSISRISTQSLIKNGLNKNCGIQYFSVSGMKNITSFSASETSILELDLNNNKIDEVILKDVNITNKLCLENLTVKSAKFYNVDLSPKTQIRLLYSTLSDSELINVRWPKHYKFYEYQSEIKVKKEYKEKLDILWALKESYRQMKVLSLNQHNKIDGLYFQKQELKIFWLITNLKTRYESFFTNIGNWFILGTNKLFSDFGQNIWRPLMALGIVHLFWFVILLWNSYDIYPCFSGCDGELTKSAFNAYFVTLLPTHGLDLTIGGASKNIGGWIDFFMRICAGYFIFYFVYSSRKYHQ